MLGAGWFKMARLTTGSHQGEESLDLSLLVLASFCWQSQGYGKGDALGFYLFPGEGGSALVVFLRSVLWLCGCVLTMSVLSALLRLSGHIPAMQIRKIGVSPEERACLDTAGLPGIAQL